jgi:hypothetical protein
VREVGAGRRSHKCQCIRCPGYVVPGGARPGQLTHRAPFDYSRNVALTGCFCVAYTAAAYHILGENEKAAEALEIAMEQPGDWVTLRLVRHLSVCPLVHCTKNKCGFRRVCRRRRLPARVVCVFAICHTQFGADGARDQVACSRGDDAAP